MCTLTALGRADGSPNLRKIAQNRFQNSREVDPTSTCSMDALRLYAFDLIRTVWTLEDKESLTLD